MKQDYIAIAKEFGFTEAAYFDPQTVSFEDSSILRDGCKANDCGFYGKYWTCPPGVGSEAVVEGRVKKYRYGMIMQLLTEAISCELQKEFFDEVSHSFNDMTRLVRMEVEKDTDEVFMLGMSNCNICEECSYPHAKCRHPEERMSCSSGHCINIYRLWDKTGYRRARLDESDFYSILLWDRLVPKK